MKGLKPPHVFQKASNSQLDIRKLLQLQTRAQDLITLVT